MEERDRHARRGRRDPAWRIVLLIALILGGACLLAAWWGAGLASEPRGPEPEPGEPVTIMDDPWDQEAPAEPSAPEESWYLALVNREHPLPEGFSVELAEVPGGERVDARIYEPLMEMLAAADAEGLGPIVASGYRTQKKQRSLYEDKIREYRGQGYAKDEAEELARQWVAEPGTSEHQLGLAVDINGATYDIYLWLQANSYQYGFIFRYPGNQTDVTGVAEEVWHYRYVGEEAAREIYERGLCLEEYLEELEA